MSLGLIVVVIGASIVRNVRLTNASLAMAARDMDLTNRDVVRSVVAKMRRWDLPHPCKGDVLCTRACRARAVHIESPHSHV